MWQHSYITRLDQSTQKRTKEGGSAKDSTRKLNEQSAQATFTLEKKMWKIGKRMNL